MLIIGCDYHPSVQQIAFVNAETGEGGERRLLHKDGEAERFYRDLKLRGVSVRVGIEATGHARVVGMSSKCCGEISPHKSASASRGIFAEMFAGAVEQNPPSTRHQNWVVLALFYGI